MDEKVYDFEKLTVYQKALDFCDRTFEMTSDLPPRFQGSLGEQMRRASLSVCNNIAEGSGRTTAKSKNQALGHSLDSARECIPMLSILLHRNLVDQKTYFRLRTMCWEITSMLFSWRRTLRT